MQTLERVIEAPEPETPKSVSPEPKFEDRAIVLPHPTGIQKALLKVPILMWRLGLGPFIGRSVMIVTTTGRKSGLPRRTPIGFHEIDGRKYIFTLRGPETDWYRNMLADPHVTIQTAKGPEHVTVRRVTDDVEVGQAYDFLAPIPAMKKWAEALGVGLSREALVAHKDDIILLTFEPTDEETPPRLKADLIWVRPLVWSAVILTVVLVRRAGRRRVAQAAQCCAPGQPAGSMKMRRGPKLLS